MAGRIVVAYHLKVVAELVLFTITLIIFLLLIFSSLETEYHQDEDKYFQFIPDCSCWRPFAYPPHPNQSRISSSCSDEATHYNKFQNVVSISFHPNTNRPVLDDIRIRLNQVKLHYPQFVMRVYTNVSLSEESQEICNLLCSERTLHWCNIHKTPSHGSLANTIPSTWRYVPLGDPTVELFLSRDVSSEITAREASTVLDWNVRNLNRSTRKAFQMIRDQPNFTKQVNGGLWAVNNAILGKNSGQKLRNDLIRAMKHGARSSIHKRGHGRFLSGLPGKSNSNDQILTNIIFGQSKSLVIYDSYHCLMWESPIEVRPIPVQRITKGSLSTDFIGWKRRKHGRKVDPVVTSSCPAECRPSFGKNWNFC